MEYTFIKIFLFALFAIIGLYYLLYETYYGLIPLSISFYFLGDIAKISE